MLDCRFWLALGTAAAVSFPAQAFDLWEFDNGITDNVLWPGAAPQRHDLEKFGGAADIDLMLLPVEQNRSYEVLITNTNVDWFNRTLELRNSSDSFLQSSAYVVRGAYLPGLRWIHTGPAEMLRARVVGLISDTEFTFYDIALRETTLFCPRYNNSGSQLSVMIVQRGANERAENCLGTAYFYNEDQLVVGTQALVIGGQGDVNVYSLPGVPGLAGQKGGAQIAHTCGLGGLKAKLVSLEPATGFSFDTPCTYREF